MIRFPCDNKRGLTFIEVLVALMIFALISTAVYNSFHVASQLNKRSADTNKVYREARWILDQIDQDLGNLKFYDFSGSYENKKSFAGSPDAVAFIIHTAEGLKIVQYYIKSTSANDVREYFLCRKTIPFARFLEDGPQSLAKEPAAEEILTDSVTKAGFKLQYSSQEGGGWQDTWVESDIPGAVSGELILGVVSSKEKQKRFYRVILIPAVGRL